MLKEAAVARLFLVLTIFALVVTLLIPVFVGRAFEGTQTEFSPRMWPYASLLSLFVFSLGGFFSFKKKYSLTMKQVLDQGFWERNLKQIFMVVFLIAYIFSMDYLGYVISSFVALVSLFYIYGSRKNHLKNILLAAVFIGITYYLFSTVFMVSLPEFSLFS